MGLLEVKSSRSDGADIVSIISTNDSHNEFVIASLENGFILFVKNRSLLT